MGLKSVTFRMEEREAEGFDQFVEASGYVKERAIVAAIRLFGSCPAELRELAHRTGGRSIKDWFEARELALARQKIGDPEESDPFGESGPGPFKPPAQDADVDGSDPRTAAIAKAAGEHFPELKQSQHPESSPAKPGAKPGLKRKTR